MTVLRADDAVVAQGRSGAEGRFRIEVAPGSYRIEADANGPGRGWAPVAVSVDEGRFSHIDIECDTGIR